MQHKQIGDCTVVISEHPDDRPFGDPASVFVVEVYFPGDDPADGFPAHIGYAADAFEAQAEALALAELTQDAHERAVAADWDQFERERLFSNAEELPAS